MFYDFVVDLFGKGGAQGFSTIQTLLLIVLHWAMFFYHVQINLEFITGVLLSLDLKELYRKYIQGI